MRAFDSEKEFASWLLHVGEGESGEKIQLPPFCYPESQDPVQQLFSDIDFKTVTPEELKGQAILTVTNDLSMQINNRVLECMPGNEVIYESIDNIVSNDPQDHLAYTEEFLNSLTPTGMPPHKLRLKPGTIIMLLRNLAPSKDPVRCLQFSPDGQYLVVAAGRHVRIFHNVPGFQNIILGLEDAKKNAKNASMRDRLQTQIDEAKAVLNTFGKS
ncbi:hypothetical protein AVEN_233601-1 [Araneus ventricosus]|uniref:DNA helicase Pif1-like 2B domain-containing protein n=1 Tax=Araneus ventricosus TaxID=182803 RepID=A0A4Y2M5Y3_ARAVE|nr:hypothetical protein AVEN_233601-1 [Araneus ventricosus]